MGRIFNCILCFGLVFIFLQCKPGSDPNPGNDDIELPGKVDFDKGATQIMDTITAGLYGKWNLRVVQVKYMDDAYQAKAGIEKDTIFKDFAVLDIQQISRKENARYPQCSGSMTFQNKTYPIAFSLIASAERIVHHVGPHAFLLLDWHFPDGSHLIESKEAFLKNIGLVGENFSLELLEKDTMIWKGLNRGVKYVALQKE